MSLPRPVSRLVVDGVIETVYQMASAPSAAEVIAEGRKPKPPTPIEEIKPRCPCGAVEGACTGACYACGD